MRIQSPSLSELHAFVAAVELRSFSRAADRLAVTQGAVSRAVLRLEARLGLPLLERDPAGVRPTDVGRRYFESVRPALTALEEAVPAVVATPVQALRVSAVPTLNMLWLVPRLQLFARDHPNIRLEFKRYSHVDDMLRDDVDCWLRTRPSPATRWPRHVKATYLTGREIVVICHPGLLRRLQGLDDLMKLPLLHHVDHPGDWAVWCQAQGWSTQDLRLGPGFDLAAGQIEAVAAGMGAAVVPRCLAEHDLAKGRVALPVQNGVSSGRGYYLCVPRAREGGAAQVAFAQWLQGQAQVDEIRMSEDGTGRTASGDHRF